MTRRLMSLAITIVVSASLTFADDVELGSIHGRVLPPDGESVLPRLITVRLTGTMFQGTKYALGGQFSFQQLPPGTYTLAVSAEGREEVVTDLVNWSPDRSASSLVVVLGRRVEEKLPATDKAVVDVNSLKIPAKAGSEFIKAVKFQNEKNLVKAEEHFKAAIRHYPNYAEAYNNLGVIYISQDRFAEADQAFTKATELSPDNVIALRNLGQARMRAGRYGEAIAPLSAVTRLESGDAKAQASLGESYLRIQNLAKARECLEKSVVLNPNLEFSRFRLGQLCLQQQDYEGALKHFRAYLALKPAAGGPQVEALVAKLQNAVQNAPPKVAVREPAKGSAE